jgi:hypothetical protein
MAGGAGKDGLSSLDEVDAPADAICFCFRGGISCELCCCRGLFEGQGESTVMFVLRWANCGVTVCYVDILGSGPKQTARCSSLLGFWRHRLRPAETAAGSTLSRNTTTELSTSTTPSYYTPTTTSASLFDYFTTSPTVYHRFSPARAQHPQHFNLSQHRQDGSRGDHDRVCPLCNRAWLDGP